MQPRQYIAPCHKPKPEGSGLLVWCGREGWLTMDEMIKRTDDAIKAYAKMQPLRFRTAMASRDYRGARIYNRTPLHFVATEPKEDNDDTTQAREACV